MRRQCKNQKWYCRYSCTVVVTELQVWYCSRPSIIVLARRLCTGPQSASRRSSQPHFNGSKRSPSLTQTSIVTFIQLRTQWNCPFCIMCFYPKLQKSIRLIVSLGGLVRVNEGAPALFTLVLLSLYCGMPEEYSTHQKELFFFFMFLLFYVWLRVAGLRAAENL